MDIQQESISDAPEIEWAPTWWYLIRTLIILLAVIGLFAYAAFPIAIYLGLVTNSSSAVAVFLAGSAIGELAALGVLIWMLGRRSINLRDLGFGRLTTWPAILIAILIALVYSAITILNPGVQKNLFLFSYLKGLAIFAALVAGVVEEVIFRGFVMTTLKQMGLGNLVQVLLSGLFFALAHVYGIFTSLGTILTTQGFTFLLGVALAAVYLLGKRSLTAPILGHALTDLIIEPALLLFFFTVK